ncbi:predicted protein [Histoplasma mississippiense (nom. inval.)]|uniref:predicted protein n=1 Tax=Ajellomyces capsulatus (strain NAm1 / WU24) TaxID=2059318 RepID=UPI000157CEE1|nr:predicted protein [Histoplasma mississippiense (nom. inval.)]EDN10939.1 predicted protein [Histoplasma mississippiense (nom. inval.)]
MDPGNQQSPEQQSAERQLADRSPANSRPSNASGTTQPQTQPGLEPLADGTAPKKRKHHGHRRRRHRRQSFAPPPDTPRPDSDTGRAGVSPGRGDGSQSTSTTAIQHRASVYRLGQLGRNNPSETSLDSDALLDHRHQPMMRPRRESRLAQSYRPEPQQLSSRPPVRAQTPTAPSQVMDEEESEEEDDRTPLIKPSSVHNSSFVRYGTSAGTEEHSVAPSPEGRKSVASSFRSTVPYSIGTARSLRREYDVNNPPSVPGSPHTGPETGFDDPMIGGHDFDHTSPEHTSAVSVPCHVIDVDGEGHGSMSNSSTTSQKFVSPELQRRRTVTLPVEEDVCFPGALSDLGEEEYPPRPPLEDTFGGGRRRRRRRIWPDLSVLREWSREEKEERSGGVRAKKIYEPVLIGGRLRPHNARWVREEEDAPYRFTYFNEEFQSTIHSQTISELVQPGQTFRDLFIPDPPELEDDSSDESDDQDPTPHQQHRDNGTGISEGFPDGPTFQRETIRAASYFSGLGYDTILQLHSNEKLVTTDSGEGGDGPLPSGSDMLRRVGECRKKVMSLYRLLGNKADVIKGFAKRCNEQWEVAPKSEIGLYLGDIQDHIVTMTSNLNHYETLLSRAHSNYLAQINIRMNERQEKTADVLGKLTVLGTIVLPMNIICGMWGMNVKVPGQDIDNLYWFWSITAGLVVFAVACFYIAKRVYGIV